MKENVGVYYSAAYADGDKEVDLFSSTDGLTWKQGAQIYGVVRRHAARNGAHVFSHPEKCWRSCAWTAPTRTCFGDPSAGARLRTKVCWASAPYSTFDCHQELSPYRLDGPVSFFWGTRLFVIARKHSSTGMRKRTALYEITASDNGGIDDGSDVAIKEWGELPSAGDTSYPGIVPTSDHQFVTAYYSGDLVLDEAWILGIFDLTDIWKASLDFLKLN